MVDPTRLELVTSAMRGLSPLQFVINKRLLLVNNTKKSTHKLSNRLSLDASSITYSIAPSSESKHPLRPVDMIMGGYFERTSPNSASKGPNPIPLRGS